VVEEDQVREELLIADQQRALASLEGEAAPELDEEVLDVIDQVA
jgi:hypothetical protein